MQYPPPPPAPGSTCRGLMMPRAARASTVRAAGAARWRADSREACVSEQALTRPAGCKAAGYQQYGRAGSLTLRSAAEPRRAAEEVLPCWRCQRGERARDRNQRPTLLACPFHNSREVKTSESAHALSIRQGCESRREVLWPRQQHTFSTPSLSIDCIWHLV
jgi:hypothetical protein